MKVEYLNPFIFATRKVLKMMAFMDSKPKKPYLKEMGNNKGLGDISSVISVSGECKGSIGISFQTKCIIKVAYQMFSEEYDGLTDEIVDMVGEIVNMVSGDARQELVKLGFHFSAGIPVTTTGNGHELIHSVKDRIIVIPFETEYGEFFIETCFDSKKFLE
ncbi:chemotaxis protein CheX [bacterium]|nr:chemotaxis protein CheX [bacterium]